MAHVEQAKRIDAGSGHYEQLYHPSLALPRGMTKFKDNTAVEKQGRW
ncbi:hypothetical protein OOU_Y34scaffold00537g1 [Pyricularia oryzae Y34]|uniref:Uncharacterized protein n=2 Tax=Pyricularia oryzae TaxID=318829 RepID=A0AA97NYH4_PYRO3|nr:hypothetical protein OOU_Y34scaffold00537g1 [Pyricularia oryzae Y34]